MAIRRRTLLQGSALLGASLLGGPAAGASSRKAGSSARALPYEDYAQADAVALAELVRSKQVSPLEVLNAAIARAEAVDPAINAVVQKYYDAARATAAGDLPAGPLRGVPMLLKDLGIACKGTPTTNGSRFFRDAVADHDSTLVQRYRAAGLVIFGKTASPEFGATATTESILWGVTRNPWNLELSSGGSSGGAAAAVAAGIIPAAHASDGGGSIRIPASHCGLFGLKPSRGRMPAGPDNIESWMGLSTSHAISRSVRDSALLLDIGAGAEAGSRIVPPAPVSYFAALATPPAPLRIALLETNPFGLQLHPDCKAAVQRTAALCEQLGHRVEPVAPSWPVGELMGAMGILSGTGTLVAIRDRERTLGRAAKPDDLEPIVWQSYQAAQKYSAEQLYRARAAADRGGRVFDEFLTRYDLILSPVTAAPPPPIGALSLDQPYERYAQNAMVASCYTALFNLTGLPAMSVPLFWNAQDLPIGSMFAGRFGDEVTLLKLAAQLEQAAPWSGKRPPLPRA